MIFDLTTFVPFAIVFIVVAALAGLTSLGILGAALTTHHRARVARHESIPTYYRRFVLAH